MHSHPKINSQAKNLSVVFVYTYKQNVATAKITGKTQKKDKYIFKYHFARIFKTKK